MSKETLEWLNQNVLVGFTSKRGHAWHYKMSEQGDEPNHYPHAIPVDDVERRLFYWDARSYPVTITVPTATDEASDMDEDGLPIRHVVLEDYQAIGRDDTHEVFKVFRSSYHIHQYRDWLLTTVSRLIDDDLSVASAGLLKNGGVAWVSIELPENIQTPSGFDVRPQLLATTSHDGSLASTFKMSSVAVVCDNTLQIGLSGEGQVSRVRHSKHSDGRLQSIRDALELVHIGGEDIVAEINRLSQIKVDDFQFNRIVKTLMPVPTLETSNQAGVTRAENKQDRIRSLYNSDVRVAPWRGTALGVVQAWNTYNHHYLGTDKRRAERNMLNALNGRTAKDDQIVTDVVMEVVGV
jgi:phage/plasmid-like protein (TIGR03299 family)